ncbi:MAG: hypothetical protein JWP06_555 [Candidatus Saccharibacteria bacterium]|jgi:hypothetical protein|nr:hypothetical protein [Candidatus Saccharibacteria bacterium]
MALFVQQNDNRSKLQEQVAAELQEKLKKRAEIDKTLPDGITDSAYLKGTKQTTSLAWVWIAIVIFAIAAFVFFIVLSSK